MRDEVARLEEMLEGYESQMRGDEDVRARGPRSEKSYASILNDYRALEMEEKEIRGDLKRFHR